ncbi:hypothetical protein ACHAW6_009006 [Cyclotella cf. meneghiniana]
MKTQNMQSTS